MPAPLMSLRMPARGGACGSAAGRRTPPGSRTLGNLPAALPARRRLLCVGAAEGEDGGYGAVVEEHGSHGIRAWDAAVVSKYQASAAVESRSGGSATTILDLALGFGAGEGAVEAVLGELGVTLPAGACGAGAGPVLVPWPEVERAASSKGGQVFEIDPESGELEPVKGFSEVTSRGYSLMAVGPDVPPTMLVAGFGMHRFKGVHPGQDTALKMKPLMPVKGCRCLDTCTGLAYTAIFAAEKGAESVVTIELDEPALDMCAANPWSRRLLDRAPPKGCPIDSLNGDAFEVVAAFPDQTFARILHDPPAEALDAHGLYSGQFYEELRRVITPGGRMFHYIGDLSSKAGKASANSAARRLESAGFSVKKVPRSYGLLAFPK